MIPEIAIIGHPNEGKSSVLSTLAEDDSVRVSAYPGETTRCRSFPVIIDGREILRFTDTPGFQNPNRLLAELQASEGTATSRLAHLRSFTEVEPGMEEDHELLLPIDRGAGIIYVVDGSRPLRNVDRSEMEILRLLGRPRMAVINCKGSDTTQLELWKDELAKHCNAVRVFNAHRATYAERIALLEALKAIDQDWQPVLAEAIRAIEADWQARTRTSARIICSLLSESLSLQLSTEIGPGTAETEVREQLVSRYTDAVRTLEGTAQQRIRTLFKHNIFNCELPPYSILHEELFSEKTWQLLGLTKKQFLLLGTIGGAAVGASIDVAALGHGLGLFTALGGVAGTITALTGRKYLEADASLLGLRIAGRQMRIGPAADISLLFVLLNRAFLFYRHITNWAHGRRDRELLRETGAEALDRNVTRYWSAGQLQAAHRLFKTVNRPDSEEHRAALQRLQEIVYSDLMTIARDD